MNIFIKIFLLISISVKIAFAGNFLMPKDAFSAYANVNNKMEIQTGIKLGKKIYIYDSALKIELINSKNFIIKKIIKPKTIKHDGSAVYMKSPNFVVILDKKGNFHGTKNIKMKLSYQGCSLDGLCYEPKSKIFELKIDSDKLSASFKNEVSSANSKTDLIADSIKSNSFVMVLITFLGFGILLSLTPCVFPMIPIISGVIISQGKGITTKKAFALSVVYVLAMAIAYTIAGVLAGLFGENLQATLQNPWVVYSFSAIFVLLAFSMFGFFELKLPDSLVSKVSSNSTRNGFIGVAIMGFLSALIVGPCVAAPLAGALVYIGQTGDALLGGAALFSMSIGMGLPLILVGVTAGKFMPKPGPWMTLVNAFFGVLMLGVSIWMLSKVVDPTITTLLYALVGIGFALHLEAFKGDGHIFKRSIALIMLIYSISLFLSVLAGSASMTKPLGFLASNKTSSFATKQELNFIKVTSINELNTAFEKNKGRKMMLDFSAKWCTSCKEFDEITFANKLVQKRLNNFVLIRADLTKNTNDEKALSRKYGVFGPPVIIFFDKNLKEIKSKRVVGFMGVDEFLTHIESI